MTPENEKDLQQEQAVEAAEAAEETTPAPETACPADEDQEAAQVTAEEAAPEGPSPLEAELAAAKDALLRTAAEYDNYRRRTTKEKEASFANGVSSAVTALLPVVDTLEMAAAAPSSDTEYKKGVEMTLTKCREALEKLGVTEIEALGQPFDPTYHAAVAQDPEGEPGTVTRVLQKGYLLAGKVVRHATVAVAGE